MSQKSAQVRKEQESSLNQTEPTETNATLDENSSVPDDLSVADNIIGKFILKI